MRGLDRIARLARDEGAQRLLALGFAALHVDLQREDVAPVRGACKRARDHGERLLDDRIDLALLRVAGDGGFDVKRAAEGIVGKLVLQRGMTGAQAAYVLRLRGAGEEGSAEQGSQHSHRTSKKRSLRKRLKNRPPSGRLVQIPSRPRAALPA
jgi:hypothetical protein